MERVADYVNQCDSLGWRPVFTREQFRVIYLAVAQDRSIPHADGHPGGARHSLFGVEFTVDDTPRPPMPENPLADGQGFVFPWEQGFKP